MYGPERAKFDAACRAAWDRRLLHWPPNPVEKRARYHNGRFARRVDITPANRGEMAEWHLSATEADALAAEFFDDATVFGVMSDPPPQVAIILNMVTGGEPVPVIVDEETDAGGREDQQAETSAKRPPSDGAVPAPSRWKAKDGAWVTLMGGTYACYVRVMAISGRYAMVRRPGGASSVEIG